MLSNDTIPEQSRTKDPTMLKKFSSFKLLCGCGLLQKLLLSFLTEQVKRSGLP